jgi:DNA-binding LacI/PurR family transcriptional regulator
MTTVEQPREEIGKLAFGSLVNIIDKVLPTKAINLKLPPRLIYRESVKKIQIITE